MCRGNANRATAITGVAHRQNTSRDHSSGTTGRAARGVLVVPGVGRDAVEPGLCGRRHAKFWGGRLAKDIHARRFVASHQRGVALRHSILEEGAAVRADGARHAHAQVLQNKGQTPERCGIGSLLALITAHGRELFGVVARQIIVFDDYCVELGQSIDAGNGCVQRLQRRQITLAQLACQSDGVHRRIALHHRLGMGRGHRQHGGSRAGSSSHEKCAAVRTCLLVLHVFVSVVFFWDDLPNSERSQQQANTGTIKVPVLPCIRVAR